MDGPLRPSSSAYIAASSSLLTPPPSNALSPVQSSTSLSFIRGKFLPRDHLRGSHRAQPPRLPLELALCPIAKMGRDKPRVEEEERRGAGTYRAQRPAGASQPCQQRRLVKPKGRTRCSRRRSQHTRRLIRLGNTEPRSGCSSPGARHRQQLVQRASFQIHRSKSIWRPTPATKSPFSP